jgi:hypothetical protein
MRPIITLLTDFGTADGYVAEVKGVLLTHAPGATLVDITHEIAPQDVTHARFVVDRYWHRFPPGTVHLVVVDPGVGTPRAALAVRADHRFLLAPDNGVLSAALRFEGAHVVAMEIPQGASPVFHGRDVFAPAAAALTTGMPIEQLGERFLQPVCLEWPAPRRQPDGCLEGEVLVIDRFGNAITNLPAACLQPAARVAFNTCELAVLRTYGDVARGQALSLVGSSGFVEIAVREGSAARRFALQPGTRVTLHADAPRA